MPESSSSLHGHSSSDESIVVGIARVAEDRVTWELRVCGIAHAHGTEPNGRDALIAAAFALWNEADKATGAASS